MNSYTLTFKNKIFIIFFLVIATIFTFDILLAYIANKKTTNNVFLLDKFSKIKHFELNNPINKDIIFIGSSRTFYHISTSTFRKNNIEIFNLGVPGAQFEDYPTIIDKVSNYNPKKVIISLSVNKLYEELSISKQPTLTEIKYYYNIDKMLFIDNLIQYIVNLHTFLQYSETIYFKILSFYNKFNSIKINHSSTISNTKYLIQDTPNNYSKLIGCNVYDVKRTHDTQILLKCNNGEGALVGQIFKNENIDNYLLSEINLKSIKYLNLMIDKLQNANIEVSLVLEPILENKYKYNLNDVKNSFPNIHIYDLTDYSISKSYWADNTHLNYEGRELYSNYLAELLNSTK